MKQSLQTGNKYLDDIVQRVVDAQKEYAHYTQEQVNEIFRRAALAASTHRIDFSRMAVEETGMGILEDKVIKNHFAAEYIYNKYKDTPTCGIIEEDSAFGVHKVAAPLGVIAAIVPTTNPTSTAIFKILLALKTRNGIVVAPHPRAKRSTVTAAKIMLEAAEAAGVPKGIIGWIDAPTQELSQALMHHPGIALILATGGQKMVRAAYSSGKPSIGVGAGNTPAVIDETAHLKMAVSSILLSKTFDNGMICASEQSVVVVDSVYPTVRDEFLLRGAHILSPDERKKLGDFIVQDGELNTAIVGQPAAKIAAMAGITVAPEAKVLIAEVEKVGPEEPFSREKLSPVLAMYRRPDFDAAIKTACELIDYDGVGHTSVLYTSAVNEDRITRFGEVMRTGRVLVNMPTSQGAIGDIYNFRLDPSLTLGCGSWGGNSVSKNVGVRHLINVKTLAERRENMLWFRVPSRIFFKPGSLSEALTEYEGRKRAFIVTDKPLEALGVVEKITGLLANMKIEFEVFSDVEADPVLSTIEKGVAHMRSFAPDLIIAFGGGSPMDAAKLMWLLYEKPEVQFEGLAMRFMDIRKRIYRFPELGKIAQFVAIPTTSGAGSEVTPFAVVTDDRTGLKYPIADYSLVPNMAVIDPQFVMTMPKRLTANAGIDALTHALEAYASVFANEFTNGLALEAARLIFKYLPSAYENGEKDLKGREKVHYAATMAGMAFANAFLGICHSMAHQLGAEFHIPHGAANALMITHVIRFNATDKPRKQATFPQYKYPVIKERYAKMADHLDLGGASADEKIERLCAAIERLKARLDLPLTIADAGVSQEAFDAKITSMAEHAFDDQCTGSNPVYPSIGELKELLIGAYKG